MDFILADVWRAEVLIWLDPKELKIFRFVSRIANRLVVDTPMWRTLNQWKEANIIAAEAKSKWEDQELLAEDRGLYQSQPDFGFINDEEKIRISHVNGWHGFYNYYSLKHCINYVLSAFRATAGHGVLRYST